MIFPVLVDFCPETGNIILPFLAEIININKLNINKLIQRNKALDSFLVKKVLLGISAVVAEILSSPVSHSAQVSAVFKKVVVDVVVLDNLPYVGIHGEGIHFPKGEKEYAIGNFFSDSMKPHKAFSGIPVLQAEKDTKLKFS